MIRFALWAGAIGACALSFGMNGYFWFATMAAVGWQAQAIAVATSVLAGVFKSILPAFVASQRMPFGKAWPLWFLFVAALAFDLASGLGFSRMSRDGAGHEQRETNSRIAKADQAVKDAEEARDRMRAPRVSVGRLQSEIEAAEARAKAAAAAAGKGCEDRRAHTEACAAATRAATDLAEAKGALADAIAHAEAGAKVAAARLARAAFGEAKAVDPQAEALSKVFSALGIEAATMALAVGLLMLLIVELGSTAAVAAAAAYRSPTPSETPSYAERLQVAAAPAYNQTALPPRIVPAATPRGRLDLAGTLAQVREGRLTVPGCSPAGPDELHIVQGALADALGTSKPTISRALRALGDVQGVSVAAGRSGTVVKFTRPAQSA